MGRFCVKKQSSLVLVANAYNLRYSGSRDQEDHGSKPAKAKKTLVEWLKAVGVAQGVGP
jgi:hypothetical protein